MKNEKKEKKKIKVSDIIIDIILALALVLLGFAIVISFKFKENPEDAYLLGYKPIYILTGSMEPTLKEKGVCIVKQSTYDDVDVGDIIMYTIDEKTITHRIVEKTNEGIRTKGDNNDVNDAYLLQDENVKAKVVLTLNFTAIIMNDLASGPIGYIKWIGYPVFVIIVIIVAKKILKKLLNKEKSDEDSDDADDNTNIKQISDTTEDSKNE